MSIKILQGDCIEVMRGMDADSIDCVVTSPPYWGLRDYGVEGQIGIEPSLGEHLEKMIEVFAEVHRILKPTGTLWLNYGDCYATHPNGKKAADYKADKSDDRAFRDKPFSTIGPINRSKDIPRGSGRWGGGNNPAQGYLKPKDLCMVPNRIAIALQEWGWYVRSEIIWAKPNPMPESIKDRPATSHEKIWLLSKSAKYFYNAEAVLEECSPATKPRVSQDVMKQAGSARANGGKKTNGNMKAVSRKTAPPGQGIKNNSSFDSALIEVPLQRNLRNVWSIPTAAFSGAHFATFPPALVERCLLAGCPPHGHVLDPFGGAGTTGLVADRMGLDATMIELNQQYIAIAKNRIEDDNPLFTKVAAE